MGQDFLRLATEDDAAQTAPTMRGDADQIAFLFLGDGNDLRIDTVALHQDGFHRDTGEPGEIPYPVEDLSGFSLMPRDVCFRRHFFRGPKCAARGSANSG